MASEDTHGNASAPAGAAVDQAFGPEPGEPAQRPRGTGAADASRSSGRSRAVWRDQLIIVLAYALAWGPVLLNRGLYWDDWTLVGLTPTQLFNGSTEIGLPWGSVVPMVLLAFPLPGLTGHVVMFCGYLLSALTLHAILLRTPGLRRIDALAAALVFAVLPVNYARLALVDLTYCLSLVAFMVATWLLVRYEADGGVGRRIAAIPLYLASFTTASLLVLYALPIVLAGWIAWRSHRTPPVSFARRHADLIVLPVVFWLVKTVAFTPTGAYAGYNAVSVRGLARVPAAMLSVPAEVLVEPVGRAVVTAGLLGVAAGLAAALWLARRSRRPEPGDALPAWTLAVVGLAGLALGVFPYLAVGKAPVLWDWSSRHQLLVPIGVGLLAAAFLRGATGVARVGPAFAVVLGLLVGMSVVADARTMLAYQVDWFKQEALMHGARTIPAMQTAKHICVVDGATAYNALARTYRFYEYNAMFSEALGGTDRLAALAKNDPDPANLATYISRPQYHMGQYAPTPVDLELRISASGHRPGALEVLRLAVLDVIDPASIQSGVVQLIDVQGYPTAGSREPSPAR